MHVLITGASGGLGRALVDECLAQGDTVVATTLETDADFPAHPRLLHCRIDVGDPASISLAAEMLASRLPALDLLINNAAVRPAHTHFTDFNVDELVSAYRVNALGPVLMARAFIPLLSRSERPRVLTIASRTGVLFGERENPGYGYGYTGTKAALHRMLALLAADLKPHNILSAGINPGLVDTPMTRAYRGERHKLPAADCARGIRQVALALTPEHAGTFIRWNGKRCDWFAPPETPEDRQFTPPRLPDPFILS